MVNRINYTTVHNHYTSDAELPGKTFIILFKARFKGVLS